MSPPIIAVESLGKSYLVGHQSADREQYTALRDVISRGLLGFGRQAANLARGRQIIQGDEVEEFWALKDVSFEVNEGEVVGIIGRNGAGKSTLLKILSRITEPTEGKVTLRGRVASLLEVGTGFHPELSGRENIFLNGAILGMTRTEIKGKFNQIVEFAEVERFLDTPVKRYSSGMYVRLAFAVAAHLDPEILVVDEVLAVGDADFQKKCLGKMKDVALDGRTVLFVSHNLGAIQSLCDRGLVLHENTVIEDACIGKCVQCYANLSSRRKRFVNSSTNKPVTITEASVTESADGTSMEVEIKIVSDSARRVAIDVRLNDSTAIPVGLGSLGTLDRREMLNIQDGVTILNVGFPITMLANGGYMLSIDVTIPFAEYLDRAEHCLDFNVNRPTTSDCRALNQAWGSGNFQIPLNLL